MNLFQKFLDAEKLYREFKFKFELSTTITTTTTVQIFFYITLLITCYELL